MLDLIAAASGVAQTAANIFGQTKSSNEAKKSIKKSTKYANKAYKLSKKEILPESVDILDETRKNIKESEENLALLEPLATREQQFNISQAQSLNEYLRAEFDRMIPKERDNIAKAAEVIALNLTGDFSQAEKSAILERTRAAAERGGTSWAINDTREMLEFFGLSRQRMDQGVNQSAAMTELANRITRDPGMARRSDFAELGVIGAGERLSFRQNQLNSIYNARVANLERQINALNNLANVQLGAATAAIKSSPNYGEMFAPLFGAAAFIAARRTREQERKRTGEEVAAKL